METSRFTSCSKHGAGLRAGAVLGLALGALLVSGCGEERLSKMAYQQKVQTEYGQVQAAFESTRDTSGAVLAARIEAARAALRAVAEALDSSEPPEQVEEENEELVEGMREYAEQLDGLVAAAREGRRAALERFNARLARSEAVEQIAEAAEEMRFKSYDLGRISEE